MKVSMKVDYGVRALVELAAHDGSMPLKASAIAARQGIPEAYLNQLLTTMHKFGLVSSRRGQQGGYFLAQDPKEINLGMVVSTLEGDSPPLDCFTGSSDCIHSKSCAQREVWRSVEEAIHNLLSATTVADLIRRQSQMAFQGTYQV